MSGIPLYIIDAFAEQAFQGNPAAVCLLEGNKSVSDDWMQSVAQEMNLSETAFVNLETRSLRWFTPMAEVDLCGHATVATVRALLEEGYLNSNEEVTFQTRSGDLTAKLTDADSIELDFPATPPTTLVPEQRVSDLFPRATWFGKSRFDLLVELENHEQVQEYQPDFVALRSLNYRGIIISSTSSEAGVDFVSRFFAPAVGVNEDPVTGSAHCCLAPYWGQKLGKQQMTAIQLSQRGGRIELAVIPNRVKLAGRAVLVLKGVLFPDANS